ncbi:MAG: Eco57I restriction-modification methylase domain-containing protein [Burkholderiales bacterium]|nr:Eco57I restriction-modification methylase domain-containing protein [Burkholderiales bacterium]
MTPLPVARFMASLFPQPSGSSCLLLDAGAGVGSLTAAFLDRWADQFATVGVVAHELDDRLRAHLGENLNRYSGRIPMTVELHGGDFIENAVNALQFGRQACFTHAILNPPYKKINSGSSYRLLLRQVGIETVNLYSAFVALAVAMMRPGGHLVAIMPRSFCNGPYYRPFRGFVLARTAIRHMHLFDKRDSAFKDDQVLQENIILLLERDATQGRVTVSTSTDDTFFDLASHDHPFERIVIPGDPERFIHVPTSQEPSACDALAQVRHSLHDIGVRVSTGPVVDFRLREHLRRMPEAGTVPLLYPGHFSGSSVRWPIPDSKKPNAIVRNDQTQRWLYPSGFYCIVRRFSSKEERRRIVASVLSSESIGNPHVVGLENHLNVFHEDRHGLPAQLAHGLAAFLNSTAADEHFRRFSGHTQVNATDLKLMKYPPRDALIALGRWAMAQTALDPMTIDARLASLT